MGTYRLSEEAKDDLIGIHQYGVRKFGEARADAYFWQIIERFDGCCHINGPEVADSLISS